MNDLAVIKATFSDFKIIRGRKVAQYIMESPLELADDCLKKLGGVPNPHQEVWVGIARLNLADASTREGEATNGTTVQNDLGQSSTTSATKPKREMTLANRIGALCDKESFQLFLLEKHNGLWNEAVYKLKLDDGHDEKKAAYVVRELCDVTSRSEIEYDSVKAAFWKTQIYEPYESWLEKQS